MPRILASVLVFPMDIVVLQPVYRFHFPIGFRPPPHDVRQYAPADWLPQPNPASITASLDLSTALALDISAPLAPTVMTERQIPRQGSDNSLSASADIHNGTGVASPRSSTDSRSSNRNQLRVSHMSPANHQHRQSLSESLRGPPVSPRTRRQPSLNQSAIQSLIDNPPPPKNVDPAFVGRDWREISIGELVSPEDLRFVELDTGIEEATNVSSLPPSRVASRADGLFPLAAN